MVMGNLDSYVRTNETRPPIYTIHENKLKLDKRLKYKSLDIFQVNDLEEHAYLIVHLKKFFIYPLLVFWLIYIVLL